MILPLGSRLSKNVNSNGWGISSHSSDINSLRVHISYATWHSLYALDACTNLKNGSVYVEEIDIQVRPPRSSLFPGCAPSHNSCYNPQLNFVNDNFDWFFDQSIATNTWPQSCMPPWKKRGPSPVLLSRIVRPSSQAAKPIASYKSAKTAIGMYVKKLIEKVWIILFNVYNFIYLHRSRSGLRGWWQIVRRTWK